MRKIFHVLSLTLGTALLSNAGLVLSASFDCTKAAPGAEQAICKDVTLSTLDERIGAFYKAAMVIADDPLKLKTEQLDWLAARNKCADVACIKASQEQRLKQLLIVIGKYAAAQVEPVASPARVAKARLPIKDLPEEPVIVPGSNVPRGEISNGENQRALMYQIVGLWRCQGSNKDFFFRRFYSNGYFASWAAESSAKNLGKFELMDDGRKISISVYVDGILAKTKRTVGMSSNRKLFDAGDDSGPVGWTTVQCDFVDE